MSDRTDAWNAIRNLVRQNGRIQLADVKEALKVDRGGARPHLALMRQAGELIADGAGRSAGFVQGPNFGKTSDDEIDALEAQSGAPAPEPGAKNPPAARAGESPQDVQGVLQEGAQFVEEVESESSSEWNFGKLFSLGFALLKHAGGLLVKLFSGIKAFFRSDPQLPGTPAIASPSDGAHPPAPIVGPPARPEAPAVSGVERPPERRVEWPIPVERPAAPERAPAMPYINFNFNMGRNEAPNPPWIFPPAPGAPAPVGALPAPAAAAAVAEPDTENAPEPAPPRGRFHIGALLGVAGALGGIFAPDLWPALLRKADAAAKSGIGWELLGVGGLIAIILVFWAARHIRSGALDGWLKAGAIVGAVTTNFVFALIRVPPLFWAIKSGVKVLFR